MSGRPCLSVVVPCFNERATVLEVVDKVLASPWVAEVVLVDDGSTDGTRELLATLDDPRLQVLLHERNAGKGAALRTGFAAATADYVIVQDADLEYDPAEYPTMLEPLESGDADVVFGSRFLSGRPHRVLYFWHSLGNRMLTLLSNMFTDLNLTDMETCYKAFRREVIQGLDLEEDRFGIEPEITAKVARGRWRIYEVGMAYAGRTYAEGKKIGWRDGFRALVCIVRYSPIGERLRRRPRADRSARRLAMHRHEVAQRPAGDQQHRLDDDPPRHLRPPVLPVGEHDRGLHDPAVMAHEPAHELGQEGVPLGGRRGRLDGPQGIGPIGAVAGRAVADLQPEHERRVPVARGATAGGGAAASRRSRRPARTGCRSRRRRRRRSAPAGRAARRGRARSRRPSRRSRRSPRRGPSRTPAR